MSVDLWHVATTPGLAWPTGRVHPDSPLDYFERNIELRGDFGCWMWTGPTDRAGYGYITYGLVQKLAYRFSYEFHRAEVPAGLTLDHLCRVKACVNPWHLEPVTPRVNNQRQWHNFRRPRRPRSKR